MILVYNFLQFILLIFTFPLLVLIVLSKKKYRLRIGDRLGIGLGKKIARLDIGNKKIIWIHCLSVGEVTSALPLVKGIQEEMDQTFIIFSVTTRSGMKIAQDKIAPFVNIVIAAPLDLLPVVYNFTHLIKPDIFILIETDFWPNWLHILRSKKVPLVLVNGRISKSSFARYQRFNFFFGPMFKTFTLLSMQTEKDATQMKQLGVSEKHIKALGNLKYDCRLTFKNHTEKTPSTIEPRLPENTPILVCGSTHPGEEKIILAAFTSLLKSRENIFLVLAPRNPGRSDEIQQLITSHGIQYMRRTCPTDQGGQILILDTIGELADFYRFAKVAFIGGSLIDFGGHNPLEAAAHGIPVLFGPYMDDFLEISSDLTDCGGALTVHSATDLEQSVRKILYENNFHQRMSKAARTLVKNNSGVINNHIQEFGSMLF